MEEEKFFKNPEKSSERTNQPQDMRGNPEGYPIIQ